MARLQNIEKGQWFRGSRFPLRDTIYSTDAETSGTEVDITGFAVEFEVRRNPNSEDTMFTLTVGSGITLSDPTNGVLDVVVPVANSTGLRPGRYHYGIRRTDSGSEDLYSYGYVWLTGGASR